MWYFVTVTKHLELCWIQVLSGAWNIVSFYDETKSEAHRQCSIKGIHVTGHKIHPMLEAFRGYMDCQKQSSCPRWGPLPANLLIRTVAGFLTGLKNSATAQARLLPLSPTACTDAVSPQPTRGHSSPYNLPRPAQLSVRALAVEEKQPPSPWQPMTSAPLFSPACPAGSPRDNVWRRMKKEGGRGESRALGEQGWVTTVWRCGCHHRGVNMDW